MTALVLLMVVVLTACAGSGGSGAGKGESIDEVLAAHTDSLMALPGVLGTAIGLCDGERCIKVLLADSSAATKSRIPARIEGYRVITEVTGPIAPR